ncbi:MAG: UDP-N-acetylmuramoyl-tripeptide--D-alanyl-D-alanine ligase, partial [Polyangiales bacterium]
VLGLGDDIDVAVLELGTNRPGEIARLADIARPDVGVVTLVAAAHTEGLGDLDAVAREKSALLMALHPSGAAVVDGDDGTLRQWADRAPAERVISFGRDEGVTVRLESWSVEADLRTRCTYEIHGRAEPLELRLRLIGEAAAINAAAAVAVVVARDADVAQAAEALEAVTPTPGRMRLVQGAGGVTLLDDSYNANPRSTALALDTLVELARVKGGRALAVLGDMLELGDRTEEEHEAVGRHAARAGVALLVGCGTHAGLAARSGAAEGMRAITAQSVDDGIVALRQELGARDVLLVKGSRSMRMERIVDALRAEEAS